MDTPKTNELSNLETAQAVFATICESYPTNQYAVWAWGERANCLLQLGQFSRNYEPATNAFQQVINSPLADIRARSMAKVGLGTVLEKQAELTPGTNKTALLTLARDHYLDVLYGKILREGEKPDFFWCKKAGWEAGRVAENLQQWEQAISIYQQLLQSYPSLAPALEKMIRRSQENRAREKT